MGAVFSPPDVFTQVLIALPLCISLELMILFFIVLDEYTLVD
jgi:Sec-independent protein secretion pathway component TatC